MKWQERLVLPCRSWPACVTQRKSRLIQKTHTHTRTNIVLRSCHLISAVKKSGMPKESGREVKGKLTWHLTIWGQMVAVACCFDLLCQTCSHRHMGFWLWQKLLWCCKNPKRGALQRERSLSLFLSGFTALACLITSNLFSVKGSQYTLTVTLPAGNYIPANHLCCSVRHQAPSCTDSFGTGSLQWPVKNKKQKSNTKKTLNVFTMNNACQMSTTGTQTTFRRQHKKNLLENAYVSLKVVGISSILHRFHISCTQFYQYLYSTKNLVYQKRLYNEDY